jgi:hypothetical protein
MKLLVRNTCFILSLVIICSGCFNPEDYYKPNDDNIITFTSRQIDTVRADGVSSSRIIVKISDKASQGRRKVIFKATSSFFLGGKGDSMIVEADPDSAFQAKAELASLRVGTANVSAEIMGVEAKEPRTVVFTKAYPNSISVSVDSFSIANNFKSEVLISVIMGARNGGKPSMNHPVKFFVSNASGSAVGTFLNNRSSGSSDAEGKVRIRYSAGELEQDGYLTITATTDTAMDHSVSATTRIFLSKGK